MISWKDDYKIGVAQIDEQHQKLFEISGRIYDLLKDEYAFDKYDRIMALIGELKDYTVFHFKSEEEYMQSIGYRKYLSQKVEHDDFIEKINQVDFNAVDENPDAYLLEILDFVVDWISRHILEKDKLITAHT